jgi:hypothetical protein
MIMLVESGELDYARAVHETIGKLLIRNDGQGGAGGANVIALGSQRAR